MILLLPLTVLVCFWVVQERDHVGSVDFNTASGQQQSNPVETKALALSTPIVTDEMMPADTLNHTAAAEAVEEIPAIEGSWTRELRDLRELAAENPEAALALVSQMPVAEEREAALRAVCVQLASSDPELAVNAAWQLQLGKLGGLSERAVLGSLAETWASADLPTALATVDQQPMDEDGRRDLLVKGIAYAWSKNAPANAARLVAEQMSPGFLQSDAAITLAGRWAALDFPGASAWVELFPDGSVQERARKEMENAMSPQK